MSKSIEQLARKYGREEKEWLDTAKRVGLDKGGTLDRTTLLTKHEVQRLVQAMGIDAGGAEEEAVVPPAPNWAPKAHEFEEASDDPVAAGALRSPANYPVFVHIDLLEEDAPDTSGPTASPAIPSHLRKRLAHKIWLAGGRGSPGRYKSTQGDASGWLRTALGSCKYYLYWSKRGSPATKAISDNLPANALIMRAVRPHDDFSALDAGSRDDYVELKRHEASTDSGYLHQPWTSEQIEWANRNETVRILRGTPGSGKTTCLQLATERRPDDNVLYLTFSERLRDRAEEDFGLQGQSANSRVEFLTVTELVERIVGERASDNLTGLAKRIDDLPRDRVSAWRQNTDELICELRAHLVGAATPSDLERLADPNCAQLSPECYRSRREEQLGKSVDSVLEIAETLAKDGESLAQAWFGGLYNAFRAVVALLDDDNDLPWAVYDRVVVDEVQDLTAIETSVFVELVHRIGRQRPNHRLPVLLVAGDEGQTVHAAGFEWGALKDLIVLRLGVTPHETELDANLRSPGRIGRVIYRAGDLYRRIDKQRRPAGNRHPEVDETAEGRVCVSQLTSDDELDAILEAVRDSPDCVVIAFDAMDREAGSVMVTPAAVKGLEFDQVLLVDAGRQLARIRHEGRSKQASVPAKLWLRREIDSLRVALSRTSADLIFVEASGAGDSANKALDHLLDGVDVITLDPREVVAELKLGDEDRGIRVQQRIERARELLETAPEQAWRLAMSAVTELGTEGLAGAIDDPEIRASVRTDALVVALRLLDRGVLQPKLRESITESLVTLTVQVSVKGLLEVGQALGRPAPKAAKDRLDADRSLASRLFAMNLPLSGEGLDRLNDALMRVANGHADRYRTLLKRESVAAVDHLRTLGNTLREFGVENPTQTADDLRFDVGMLLRGQKRFELALQALETMNEVPMDECAELDELLEDYDDAGKKFEAVGRHADALRCYRKVGDLDASTRAARAARDEATLALLQWQSSVEHILATKRRGDLTDAEAARLRGKFDAVVPRQKSSSEKVPG